MRYKILAAAVVAFAFPAGTANAAPESGVIVTASTITTFPSGQTDIHFAEITGSETGVTGVFGHHSFGDGFDIEYTVAVDCLNVSGATAYIGGMITTSNRIDIAVGTPIVTALRDGAITGEPDTFSAVYLNPGFDCTQPVALEFTITAGDISVVACKKLKLESGKCKFAKEPK